MSSSEKNIIHEISSQHHSSSNIIGSAFKSFSIFDYEKPLIPYDVSKKIEVYQKQIHFLEQNFQTHHTLSLKDDYQHDLNSAQWHAVTTISGSVLVIAGAGTGKTRTIVHRLAYLIEKGIHPRNLLLLTFTRKAATEMLKRASDLLGDTRGNQIVGGTFHSFSNYILRKYSQMLELNPKFSIIDTEDAEDIIDLVKKELHFEKQAKTFPRKNRLYEIISASRNRDLSIHQIIQNEFSGLLQFVNEIESIYAGYTLYKKKHHVFDYDDLMECLRDRLQKNDTFRMRVQSNFSHIMVDEYQDTNVIQRDIVDILADTHKNLMVVGDDSQSIYSFRGASFENIVSFPSRYPDTTIIKIEQNYRSSQPVLDFSNAIVSNMQLGYKKQLFSEHTAGIKPKIISLYQQEDEAELIVKMILQLHERGIPFDHIAVLYRATYHGNYIQAELLKHNIPYVVYGGMRFIERRHIKDMVAYLRLLLNVYDAVSWNRVLKLINGIGSATSEKIINIIMLNRGNLDIKEFKNKSYSKPLEELFVTLSQAAGEKISLSEKISLLQSYYYPLLKTIEADALKRIQDIEILKQLSMKYRNDELEKFLSDFALDPPSQQFQDSITPMMNESEEKPLVLSTIHSAKGLEWHTVFIPHLLDGIFPAARSLKTLDELEEERRLFYVACTRAKEQLILTYPSYIASWDAYFTRPSRFLVEIPQKCYTYGTDEL